MKITNAIKGSLLSLLGTGLFSGCSGNYKAHQNHQCKNYNLGKGRSISITYNGGFLGKGDYENVEVESKISFVRAVVNPANHKVKSGVLENKQKWYFEPSERGFSLNSGNSADSAIVKSLDDSLAVWIPKIERELKQTAKDSTPKYYLK